MVNVPKLLPASHLGTDLPFEWNGSQADKQSSDEQTAGTRQACVVASRADSKSLRRHPLRIVLGSRVNFFVGCTSEILTSM